MRHIGGMADDVLTLMAVHAHPDDESSKGAATMAKYAAEGVRTVLVCCTGGEAGDILNPEADTPEVQADLGAVRMRELDESVQIIGYSQLHLLGYRDSGMMGTPDNDDPSCFWRADLLEAGVMRRAIQHLWNRAAWKASLPLRSR